MQDHMIQEELLAHHSCFKAKVERGPGVELFAKVHLWLYYGIGHFFVHMSADDHVK